MRLAPARAHVLDRLNLDDPKSFLVSQSFPVNNKDVLYISNASLVEPSCRNSSTSS